MDIFDPQSDWKIYFPERNIYIMKDHSWAFAAWELERIKGTISPDSVLLHFDYHLDDVPDGLFVDGVMSAQTKEELFSVIRTNKELYSGEPLKSKIQIDNFIWPSFARGTVSTMFSVAPQEQQDLASWMVSMEQIDYERDDFEWEKESILRFIPMEKFKSVYRSSSFQEFKEKHLSIFQESTNHKQKILDIDLDYFNLSQSLYNAQLMDDEIVSETITELLELCEWDLITVALSPMYCGGNENAEHLLNIFMEVANLKMNKLEMEKFI